jgi:hypothetical protein
MPNIPLLHLATLELCHRLEKQSYHNSQRRRTVQRPLLLSILALGAAYDLRPILARKLFEETGSLIRQELKTMSDNSSESQPQNMQLIQAFIHYIKFCLCAGDMVLEQIAVSHICCLASLIREARLFRPLDNRTLRSYAMPNDLRKHRDATANNLDHTWQEWAIAEEARRTYFCAYFVCSAGLTLINPSEPFLGHSHVELSLPCREHVWQADTAEAWKDSIKDCIGNAKFHTELEKLFKHASSSYVHQLDHHTGISEFGCLVLIVALNESIWEWRKNRRFSAVSGDGTCEEDFQRALQNWEAQWKVFPRPIPPFDVRDKLSISCLSIYDHIELMFQVDLSAAKDALQSRDYRSTSEAFQDIFVPRTEIPTNELLIGDNSLYRHSYGTESSSRGPQFVSRKLANHAAHALRLSFEVAPWWTISLGILTHVTQIPY